MRRFIKVCLITGIICFLVGGGISLVAAVLGGDLWEVAPHKAAAWKKELSEVIDDDFLEDLDEDWLPEDYGNVYEQDDFSIENEGQEIFSSARAAQTIKKLDLEVRTGRVVFVEDLSSDKITIYCNRDESYWHWHIEDDGLEVQLYPGGTGALEDSDVLLTIHVPKDYHFSSVDIKSTRAKRKEDSEAPIIKAQSLLADEMNLETKIGAIIISQGNVGTLQITSDVGAVDYSGSVSGDIDADCKVGGIHLELAGKKEDYNYEIQTVLGAVKIGDESSAAFKNNRQVNNEAGKEMDLECKTGAIQVDFMNDL